MRGSTQVWTFRPRCLGANELAKRWKFAGEKSRWRAAVNEALEAHRPTTLRQYSIAWHFVEPNQKRDKPNIVAGADKAILDALVSERVLQDDAWVNIIEIEKSQFSVDKDDPRIILTVVPFEPEF